MWAELGRPQPFTLLDTGPDRDPGLSILEGLRRHGATDLLAAIRYEPVESNPNRLADLRERFERAGLAESWRYPALPRTARARHRRPPCQRVPRRPAGPPRRRPRRQAARALRRLARSVRPGSGRAVDSELAAAWRTTPRPGQLAEGQVAEICLELEPWLDEVGRRLARGFVSLSTTATPPRRVRPAPPRRHVARLPRHRVQEDPFTDPGLTDLTATSTSPRSGPRGAARPPLRGFDHAVGVSDRRRPGVGATGPAGVARDHGRGLSARPLRIVRMLDPRHMGASAS